MWENQGFFWGFLRDTFDINTHSVYLYSMNTRELVKKLRELGFQESGTKKHVKLRHPDGRWTVVSKGLHEIDIDLLKKMEQQIGEKLR